MRGDSSPATMARWLSFRCLRVQVRACAPSAILSKTGAELLFEVFSQRYERGSILVTSNLPFDEWTEIFGSERLTGALLDRLTHHVHILEMNGDSYRLKQSKTKKPGPPERHPLAPVGPQAPPTRAAAFAHWNGTPRRARGPPVDYGDRLLTEPKWPNLTPPHDPLLLRR